jgi:hypothetical protein
MTASRGVEHRAYVRGDIGRVYSGERVMQVVGQAGGVPQYSLVSAAAAPMPT